MTEQKKGGLFNKVEPPKTKQFYGLLNPRPKRKEKKTFPPSVIVPDRNMSMSVIMQKYAGGQFRGQTPNYTDPEMMDYVQGIDARKLSVTELQLRIRENKQKIQNIRSEIQAKNQAELQEKARIAQEQYRKQLEEEIRTKMAKETSEKH